MKVIGILEIIGGFIMGFMMLDAFYDGGFYMLLSIVAGVVCGLLFLGAGALERLFYGAADVIIHV